MSFRRDAVAATDRSHLMCATSTAGLPNSPALDEVMMQHDYKVTKSVCVWGVGGIIEGKNNLPTTDTLLSWTDFLNHCCHNRPPATWENWECSGPFANKQIQLHKQVHFHQ